MRDLWRIAAVGIMLVCGCRKGTSSGSSSIAAPAAKSTSALHAEIEDQLKSALYQLQPENLGVDARLDDAVSVLNNWWSAAKAAKLEPTGLTPPAIPAGRVPDELRPQLERESFGLEDGLHIRAAFLAKVIADRVGGQSEQELDRVCRTFEWVCRNVVLVSDDEPLPPVTVYELLMLGRGRSADRAWIFGEVLKQNRIDAVAIRAKEGSNALLVGVLLDGQLYLFDPQLGIPIPRGDDPVTMEIRRPATLREVREHPDWLKSLSTRSDQPYEPTAEQLADPQIDAMTSVFGWSPRMWKLEQMLPGESLCVLYEAPDQLGDAPSIFARIAATEMGWESDKIGVWPYPLQRHIQFARIQGDANARNMLRASFATFSVPLALKQNEKGDKQQLMETMGQLKTRTMQLQGRYSDAIAHYVTSRQLATTQPPDPSLGPIYQRASEDAFYWSCVCKYESGEYDSAVTSLTDYLKRYRRGGNWTGPASLLLAQCHRELHHLSEAVQSLKTSNADDAYRTTLALLAKRWGEAATEKHAAEARNQ